MIVAAVVSMLWCPNSGRAADDEAAFTFAAQGDINALDPYTLNETFTLGVLGNVMERLTRRDAELRIVPALATRWEPGRPTGRPERSQASGR